jgi:hypothetical protein
MMPDSLVRRHVTEAIARHASAAALIRAVAAELGPRAGRPWLAMADALARGDVAAGTAAAARDPACWVPLFSTPAGDPRLWGRIVAAAGKPRGSPEPAWVMLLAALGMVGLPLAVLFGFSFLVVPMFEEIYDDFGSELPSSTQWALAIAHFMQTIWKPLVLTGLLVAVGWALARWWIRRGANVAAAFTRHLARLVEGGVPQDESLELATRAVQVSPVSPARPRRPLTHAAVAALAYDPPVAGGLLDAVAECHALRAVGGTGTAGNVFGTVAYVGVAVIVAFYIVALFMPLIRVIQFVS